jgi:hypothetical protein
MRIRFPHPLYEADGAAPGAGAAPGGEGGDTLAKPAMPEGLPADFWDADKGEVKFGDLTARLGELAAFKAEQDARAAELPAKPEDYKIELPATFKAPDGIDMTIDEKDPAVGALRAFAHEHKLPQAAVSAILAIDAQRKIDEFNASVALAQQEEAALGEKFPERKAAVEDFLRGNLDERQYEGIRARIDAGGAAGFEAIEKLIELANAGAIPDGEQKKGPSGPMLLKDILYPQKAS